MPSRKQRGSAKHRRTAIAELKRYELEAEGGAD